MLLVGACGTAGLRFADDLPPHATGEEYQIWPCDRRGETSAAGTIVTDDNGHAQVELTPPLAFSAYMAVAVSTDPADGRPQPTGPLVAGC